MEVVLPAEQSRPRRELRAANELQRGGRPVGQHRRRSGMSPLAMVGRLIVKILAVHYTPSRDLRIGGSTGRAPANRLAATRLPWQSRYAAMGAVPARCPLCGSSALPAGSARALRVLGTATA